MAERASTPPARATHPGTLPPNPLTPEQVRRTEEARLKAKALREQGESAARARGEPPVRVTPNGFIAGQKRPFSSISSRASVPSNQRDGRTNNASPEKLNNGLSRPPVDDAIRPAKKFEKYIEYDFSTMTDTKGGFLSQTDDPHNRALHATREEEEGEQKPAHMTMAEWERQQLLKKLRAQRQGPFEPGISVMDKDTASKKCRECGSLEIDWNWADIFGCTVCNACKDKFPEKYSLLTKTEAREDYLLTDPELKDPELLPWLEKPNPHKATWNNMQLYLRYQVEEYAFSDRRWGSAEALDAEFERRQEDKKKKKEKKFKNRLEDLKKRTRVEAYKRSRGLSGVDEGGGGGSGGGWGRRDKHEHEWGRPVDDPETGISRKRCVECGMEVEELEL
ncbi:DNA repair protein [Rhizodiscina lignyota]|uniref:DNA repair protein RAD14 n=1 Tax=Rhizodiscina lignyota TaxID=1504668 RepID=A0A9P4I9J2_9PEZI|nr:DNA repair protein [Rhizodiscina lignyota]